MDESSNFGNPGDTLLQLTNSSVNPQPLLKHPWMEISDISGEEKKKSQSMHDYVYKPKVFLFLKCI